MKKPKMLQQRVHRIFLVKEAEHFREHKKGLPEWIKNSDDSYTRHEEFDGADFSNLPILINISKREIICLDFGGADAKSMIEHIPFYGSPEAATQGKSMSKKIVSGGHGNGGKFYAISEFEDCEIISYYKGKLTILRINKGGDYIVAENEEASPYEVIDMLELDRWHYFKTNRIGKYILDGIETGNLNVFCWKGINPRDKKQVSSRRDAMQLLNSVVKYPQARSALRDRTVSALFEGEEFWPSMKPKEVEPDETFGVREFALPNQIEQFKFNKHYNSTLKVILSKQPLTGDDSSLNILEIDAFGKNVAYYEIPKLMMDKGLSKNLYAHIDCPELKEYMCISNDRVNLIENLEISNIFLDWCKLKLKEVLDELTNKEKKKEEKKDLEELGNFLKDITKEISELLVEDIMKPSFKKGGQKQDVVGILTDEAGFGLDGKIKNKGGGKRRGGKGENKADSVERKSKSMLTILISGHDLDPLNPGKTFDMIERQPILFQRVEDVDHGIWWINSQKSYVKKIKIKDPKAIPFYFFLVKEIVFSHRTRRKFKEQDGFDPDGLEELNFRLIDEIFNKTLQRLGIELMDQTMANKIRECLKSKNKFIVSEISEELLIDPMAITIFINDPSNGVLDNFKVVKKANNKGPPSNLYVKK